MAARLPAGHVLRAARPDDLDAVHRVHVAAEEAHDRLPHLSRHDIAHRWAALDLARDAWIVEDAAGAVVAIAWQRQLPGASEVSVHPDAEGQGLGSVLLEAVEARTREAHPGKPLRQFAVTTNAAADSLLRRAGYAPAQRYMTMWIELAGPPEEPPLPAGIDLRAFRRGTDDRAVFDLDNAAFADYPDFLTVTFEHWHGENVLGEGWAPAASPLAWEGDRAVGFALCRWRAPGRAAVEILGVHPDAQGRGIGRALLMRAFAELARRGATEARLGVAGFNDRARALYESAGMRVRDVVERYEKPAPAQ